VIDLRKMTILTISLLGREAWGRQQRQVLPLKNTHKVLETIQASIFDHDSPLVVKLLNGQKVAYVVGSLPIFTSTKC